MSTREKTGNLQDEEKAVYQRKTGSLPECLQSEWPNSLCSPHQVTEVKLV